MSGVTAGRTPPARAGRSFPNTTLLEEQITRLLRQEMRHPVPLKRLRQEIARQIESQREGRIEAALERLVERGEVLDLQDGAYFLAANLDDVERRICEVIRAYHAAYPYDPGMAVGEIKKRFAKSKTRNVKRNIDPQLFERAFSACKDRGLIIESRDGVRLAEFSPTSGQIEEFRRLEEAVIAYVDQRRYHRLDLDVMANQLDANPRSTREAFLRALKAAKLVKYGDGRFMPAAVFAQIQSQLASEFAQRARLSTAEIKALLGIPRNAVIELLEHCDAIGFTRRDGDERVLSGAADT